MERISAELFARKRVAHHDESKRGYSSATQHISCPLPLEVIHPTITGG